MADQGAGAVTIACIADQSAGAAVLHEAICAVLPGAEVSLIDTGAERGIPEADCVVVDAVVNGVAGIDVLRRLRARGFGGSAVLVVDDLAGNGADELAADAARMGASRRVPRDSLGEELAPAIADALRSREAAGDPRVAAALSSLRQTQRLIAAGQIAIRLQHSLNNPLAGLLAESQLLELEPMDPDHKKSVQRIIELCRRVVDVVRGLDGVGRA